MFATQKQNPETVRPPLLWDSVTTVTWSRPTQKPSFKLVRPAASFGKVKDDYETELLEKEQYCCDRATD